jgi:three-Cys-motif partner protein
MNEKSSKNFGGQWSDEKLDALRDYLTSYAQALSKASFERIYIDAFAGAGTVEAAPCEPTETWFDEELAAEDAGYRHGSPLIALGIEPSFHRFIFIEHDTVSIASLRQQVSEAFPAKLENASFLQVEANEALQSITRKGNWKSQRAVAFLDPFALHVKWETIEAIARTQAIDMWLLFPAMAVNRMLPRNGVVPKQWADKLSGTFGSSEWESCFYERQSDMFGEETISKQPKIFDKLSEFITMRLNTVFAEANKKPLILKNSTGAPLFLLCFACGNPKGAPIALRIANHIINRKNHGH